MMIDGLERICKEDAIASSKYSPENCLKELRKKTIAGVPADFRTEHLLNMTATPAASVGTLTEVFHC
jgi:hypothetical protein